MKRFDQRGSHIIALVLFLVVVGAVGFAGYRVWQLQSKPAASTPSGTTTTASATVPTTIQSSADLSQTANALDQASSQLDASMNDTALNTDMQSML